MSYQTTTPNTEVNLDSVPSPWASSSIPNIIMNAFLAASVFASFLVLPVPWGKSLVLTLQTMANLAMIDGFSTGASRNLNKDFSLDNL